MKAGRILKLAGPNYLNGLAEHHREVATKQLNTILDTAEMFNTDLAAIQNNGKLSPEGRVEEGRKVAAAALSKLTMVESIIKTLTERTATLEQSLLKKVTLPAPKDLVAHELHLQEIRSQLRELSASERLNVYRTSTDPLVLAAIETAPMTLSPVRQDGSRRMESFVDPEQMAVVKLERAEKADPATATTLREVRGLREIYSHAVNGVRKDILDEVPGVEVVTV